LCVFEPGASFTNMDNYALIPDSLAYSV